MAGEPDTDKPSSLDEFSKRLDAARGVAETTGDDRAQQGRAMGQGFRLASELLAAMIVGPFLGWALDRVAGTAPFGLLAGIALGFAAGVLNVAKAMKAVGEDDTNSAPPGGGEATDEAD